MADPKKQQPQPNRFLGIGVEKQRFPSLGCDDENPWQLFRLKIVLILALTWLSNHAWIESAGEASSWLGAIGAGADGRRRRRRLMDDSRQKSIMMAWLAPRFARWKNKRRQKKTRMATITIIWLRSKLVHSFFRYFYFDFLIWLQLTGCFASPSASLSV